MSLLLNRKRKADTSHKFHHLNRKPRPLDLIQERKIIGRFGVQNYVHSFRMENHSQNSSKSVLGVRTNPSSIQNVARLTSHDSLHNFRKGLNKINSYLTQHQQQIQPQVTQGGLKLDLNMFQFNNFDLINPKILRPKTRGEEYDQEEEHEYDNEKIIQEVIEQGERDSKMITNVEEDVLQQYQNQETSQIIQTSANNTANNQVCASDLTHIQQASEQNNGTSLDVSQNLIQGKNVFSRIDRIEDGADNQTQIQNNNLSSLGQHNKPMSGLSNAFTFQKPQSQHKAMSTSWEKTNQINQTAAFGSETGGDKQELTILSNEQKLLMLDTFKTKTTRDNQTLKKEETNSNEKRVMSRYKNVERTTSKTQNASKNEITQGEEISDRFNLHISNQDMPSHDYDVDINMQAHKVDHEGKYTDNNFNTLKASTKRLGYDSSGDIMSSKKMSQILMANIIPQVREVHASSNIKVDVQQFNFKHIKSIYNNQTQSESIIQTAPRIMSSQNIKKLSRNQQSKALLRTSKTVRGELTTVAQRKEDAEEEKDFMMLQLNQSVDSKDKYNDEFMEYLYSDQNMYKGGNKKFFKQTLSKIATGSMMSIQSKNPTKYQYQIEGLNPSKQANCMEIKDSNLQKTMNIQKHIEMFKDAELEKEKKITNIGSSLSSQDLTNYMKKSKLEMLSKKDGESISKPQTPKELQGKDQTVSHVNKKSIFSRGQSTKRVSKSINKPIDSVTAFRDQISSKDTFQNPMSALKSPNDNNYIAQQLSSTQNLPHLNEFPQAFKQVTIKQFGASTSYNKDYSKYKLVLNSPAQISRNDDIGSDSIDLERTLKIVQNLTNNRVKPNQFSNFVNSQHTMQQFSRKEFKNVGTLQSGDRTLSTEHFSRPRKPENQTSQHTLNLRSSNRMSGSKQLSMTGDDLSYRGFPARKPAPILQKTIQDKYYSNRVHNGKLFQIKKSKTSLMSKKKPKNQFKGNPISQLDIRTNVDSRNYAQTNYQTVTGNVLQTLNQSLGKSGTTDKLPFSNPPEEENKNIQFPLSSQPNSARQREQSDGGPRNNIIILNTESDRESNDIQIKEHTHDSDDYETNDQVAMLQVKQSKEYINYGSKRLMLSREQRRFKREGGSRDEIQEIAGKINVDSSRQSQDDGKNVLNYQSMISNNSSVRNTQKNTNGQISPRNNIQSFNLVPNTQIFYPKYSASNKNFRVASQLEQDIHVEQCITEKTLQRAHSIPTRLVHFLKVNQIPVKQTSDPFVKFIQPAMMNSSSGFRQFSNIKLQQMQPFISYKKQSFEVDMKDQCVSPYHHTIQSNALKIEGSRVHSVSKERTTELPTQEIEFPSAVNLNALDDLNLNFINNQLISKMIQPYKYTLARNSNQVETSNVPTTLHMQQVDITGQNSKNINMTVTSSLENPKDIKDMKIHHFFNEKSSRNPQLYGVDSLDVWTNSLAGESKDIHSKSSGTKHFNIQVYENQQKQQISTNIIASEEITGQISHRIEPTKKHSEVAKALRSQDRKSLIVKKDTEVNNLLQPVLLSKLPEPPRAKLVYSAKGSRNIIGHSIRDESNGSQQLRESINTNKLKYNTQLKSHLSENQLHKSLKVHKAQQSVLLDSVSKKLENKSVVTPANDVFTFGQYRKEMYMRARKTNPANIDLSLQ